MFDITLVFKGHCFVSQIFFQSAVLIVTSLLNPLLISSARTLSLPGDLPFCRLQIASSTSSLITGSREGSFCGRIYSFKMLVLRLYWIVVQFFTFLRPFLRTSSLSVSSFPSQISMTIDLSCFLMVIRWLSVKRRYL